MTFPPGTGQQSTDLFPFKNDDSEDSAQLDGDFSVGSHIAGEPQCVADQDQVHGGRLLLYNPSENWEALPSDWLPGSVQSWTCNHPQVRVTKPEHAITHGYASLKAETITRFQATSAQVAEAAHYAPFIKSFLAVSNEWRTLTYPAVLAGCAWGNGRILIDLIPENRTILLRCLSYLTRR